MGHAESLLLLLTSWSLCFKFSHCLSHGDLMLPLETPVQDVSKHCSLFMLDVCL